MSALHVREEGPGDATPLVLLHGFTGNGAELLAVARELPAQRRRIAFDLLGHGDSDSPRERARYAFDVAVREIVDAIDRVAHGELELWGYSLGARLALAIALELGDRVRALVLESGSPGIAEDAERETRQREDEALADRIERDGVPAFIDQWERHPLFVGERDLPSAARLQIRATRLAQNASGLAGSLRGMGVGAQAPLWSRLGELRAPTLLLTGERDAKFTRTAIAMQLAIDMSRHISIKTCGHAPHRERPAETAAAVAEFLKNPRGAP